MHDGWDAPLARKQIGQTVSCRPVRTVFRTSVPVPYFMQIEEMRTVGWFREHWEKLRLAEEEEAREQLEREQEERFQAQRPLEVCVQGSASLHLCMDGVSTVLCGLQEAQRREEAARARKKKDAETALLEAKLKELQKELHEAWKSKMDRPKEPTLERVPEDTDDGQEVEAEQAGAQEPVAEGTDAPQPEPGIQACVCFNVF